ncbi:MAG: tRNA pseudouridine(55) synthase TruB [Oscillospiraceae bacterium]|jgi:tRNA pseudouridine55 synthase|nr:tRNA pseudouridine(55) synthase TruB [Oscillospiraceae bacterium]
MPSGIIVIDKPTDWTSHDVVARLRRLLGERRIGHGGTLDPMATGVLPVFVGRATRAVEFIMDGTKEYIAGLRLGVSTDTQDCTGSILEEKPVLVDQSTLEQTLSDFRGDLQQIPPMYSAIKQNGKKLYELARSGKEVERPPRSITIDTLELLEQCSESDYLLRVVCSKGTYIRTLCHDIGQALGCGGALYSLRRTRSSCFTIDQAVSLDVVAEQAKKNRASGLLLPVDQCFLEYPALQVPPALAKKCRNGAFIPFDGVPGTYRAYDAETGEFLLLGSLEQQGSSSLLKPIKSFYEV